MDLIVKNARLRDRDETTDIGIENGVIVKIAKPIAARAGKRVDAAGCLTVPAFVDPHIHLDKALTIAKARVNESGSLEESIAIMREAKSAYTVKDVEERATTVIRWAVKKGVTFIRSYVDVDPIVKLTAMRGVEKAKANCSKIAHVETIAFPQEGIFQEPGTEELLHQAVALGADVVGGMPANEMIEEHSRMHIDLAFDIARKAGIDIQMHIDETDDPSVRTIHYLAFKTIAESFQGRVSADHVCALASYNDIYADFIIAMIKKAQLNIVSNPYRLMRGGLADRGPRRRGITRVKKLLDAGVNVCYGQDVVLDGFSPIFGQCDPLEVGFLMAHAAQLNTFEDMRRLFDMATYNGARLMRLKSYGIEAGAAATLTVIDCPNVNEAFRLKPKRLFVIKDGRIIVKDEELIVS